MSTIGGAGGSNGVGLLQGRSSLKGSLVIGGESASSEASRESIFTQITSSRSASLSQERASKFLSLSSVKRATEVASEGVNAIASLRAEQVSIVAEIADSAYGERSEVLSSRLSDIEAEIVRVVEGATYNGVNVLTESRTYALESPTAGVSETVSLPGASSVISVNFSKITSQEDAVSAYGDYLDVALSAQGLSSAVASAQGKAGQALESAVVSAKEDPSVLTDPNEAEAVAKKVASELVSSSSNENARLQIIEASVGALSSSKVQNLLS